MLTVAEIVFVGGTLVGLGFSAVFGLRSFDETRYLARLVLEAWFLVVFIVAAVLFDWPKSSHELTQALALGVLLSPAFALGYSVWFRRHLRCDVVRYANRKRDPVLHAAVYIGASLALDFMAPPGMRKAILGQTWVVLGLFVGCFLLVLYAAVQTMILEHRLGRPVYEELETPDARP